MTINWSAFLPDLALALAALAVGYNLGSRMARRDYARDLARLRSLVPEPELLRRAACHARRVATVEAVETAWEDEAALDMLAGLIGASDG